jgi:hypothetical protein
MKRIDNTGKALDKFLQGKSAHTIMLLEHFIRNFKAVGKVTLIPAKTMIGVATDQRRIAWITQLGKNFIHVVFPFKEEYPDNLCFQKIAQVPDDTRQFNHHYRMYEKEDLNKEVIKFMKMAYKEGSAQAKDNS